MPGDSISAASGGEEPCGSGHWFRMRWVRERGRARDAGGAGSGLGDGVRPGPRDTRGGAARRGGGPGASRVGEGASGAGAARAPAAPAADAARAGPRPHEQHHVRLDTGPRGCRGVLASGPPCLTTASRRAYAFRPRRCGPRRLIGVRGYGALPHPRLRGGLRPPPPGVRAHHQPLGRSRHGAHRRLRRRRRTVRPAHPGRRRGRERPLQLLRPGERQPRQGAVGWRGSGDGRLAPGDGHAARPRSAGLHAHARRLPHRHARPRPAHRGRPQRRLLQSGRQREPGQPAAPHQPRRGGGRGRHRRHRRQRRLARYRGAALAAGAGLAHPHRAATGVRRGRGPERRVGRRRRQVAACSCIRRSRCG